MTDAVEKEKTTDRLQGFHDALQRGDLPTVHASLAETHPAEIAVLLESLPPDDRTLAWSQVGPEQVGEVLTEVHENDESLFLAQEKANQISQQFQLTLHVHGQAGTP